MDISKTERVKEYILDEVKAGRIVNGQRLPSCREIAHLLGINKITVNKAYAQLEQEHKVFSIPRGGYYLVECQDKSAMVHKKIDFCSVKPDDKLIPYREFTHVINKAVELYKNNLFGYETTIGLASLREALRKEFEKDGIYTTSDNIIVTHGAQQAINLVFQTIFLNNKGKLLVERPSYNLALKLAQHLHIDMVGIDRKIEGYDFNEMETIFKTGDIVAFYVISRHHNPTGYSLFEKEKKKVAELCNKYNVIIIEDDYLADLGAKKGAMPIHYYDTSKKSIYIRSFSKTFMPGIRIGVAVVPKMMVETVVRLKHLSDLSTSKLPQAALELFIKTGMYEKHIKKVKRSYEAKLRKAKEILLSLSSKELVWHVPEHGIFIWLQLPEGRDIAAIEERLDRQGILINSAKESFLKNRSEKELEPKNLNYIRLCISGVSEEDISAIATVVSAISEV